MGIYLVIGGVDVSAYITENDYSVSDEPIFDTQSEFVNIYGEKVRSITGKSVYIAAKLFCVGDDVVGSVCTAAEGGIVTVSYSSPAASSGSFYIKRLSRALDCVKDGVKYWNMEIELTADIIDGNCL